MIAKINNLNVAVPDISYYTDSESTYRKILANQVRKTISVSNEIMSTCA